MNFFTTTSTADLEAALADATQVGPRGLVVDLRGDPGVNNYTAAMRLIREPFQSPQFHIRTRTGPDSTQLVDGGFSLSPFTTPPVWDGPIVLLTGPHAVSAAENFMQML